MKRILMLAGVLAVAGGPAFSAINPVSPGLPGEVVATSWTMTAAQGYGAVATTAALPGLTTNDSKGSAMCVECHSVNPSYHVLGANATYSAYTGPARGGSYAVDTTAANTGSHFVMNVLGTPTGTALVGSTNSGGGFLGGFSNAARATGGAYMMKVAWPANTAGTAPVSKYNQGTGLLSLPATGGTANVNFGSAADIICESCHNVLANNGSRLLLGSYADATNDDICVRCHSGNGSASGVAAGYEAFHANDNLAAFAGTTVRKRHHVLTGNTFGFYGATGISSLMWAPTFSDKVAAGWCGAGAYTNQSTVTTLTASTVVNFRNECSVSGVGARAAALAAGDINAAAATGGNIRCVNCHRPHNAMASSGAFIFRTGTGSDFSGGGRQGNSRAASGTLGYGLRRQVDVGDWSTAKAYNEYAVLCNGCHQGYGQ